MLLSIIIPVYNTQDYILESLNSLVHQLDDDTEVIIINDGSTDNSSEIASEFLKSINNNNICLYDKENGGLSDARNYGLALAKGKYIAFLDSDDVVSPDYYISLKNCMVKNNTDIIEFDAYRFSSNNTYSMNLIYYPENLSYSEKLDKVFYGANWFSWCRIYKKELFKNIKYPYKRRFEDLAVTPLLYLESRTIFTINKELIGYRDNPSGITNNIKREDIGNIEKAIDDLFSWQKSYGNKNTGRVLSLALLKLSIYVKYINQELNPSNFSLSKELRIKIFKKIHIIHLLRKWNIIIYLLMPSLIVKLSKVIKSYQKFKGVVYNK